MAVGTLLIRTLSFEIIPSLREAALCEKKLLAAIFMHYCSGRDRTRSREISLAIANWEEM